MLIAEVDPILRAISKASQGGASSGSYLGDVVPGWILRAPAEMAEKWHLEIKVKTPVLLGTRT